MLAELKSQIKELDKELKEFINDDLKDKDPGLYYRLLCLYNKYFGRNPYENIDEM